MSSSGSVSGVDDLDAVQVLDHLVRRAVKMESSDIHLEPFRDGLRVRYRIDGVMTRQGTLPLEISPALNSRIKVLARMDMTERRLPQDGQFSLDLGGPSLVHLRASTFPSIHGETVVLRLLLGHELISLDRLGMAEEQMRCMSRLSRQRNGLILVCGPTGSGKTSTLYSMLGVMDTSEQSVVTLEDPIEVEFGDITQGQTNNRQGFTFAAGLRSILRQDPDVIFVGEMRDAETTQIALQASLTGHLVLSTLHTADTIDSILRLTDLGAETWIVANALLAVVAQRLVRRLCSCAEPATQPADILGDGGVVLLASGASIRQPKGCSQCHDTGYHGRVGLFELLELNEDIRELIKSRATKRQYREILHGIGMRTLSDMGFDRVREGITSVEEVVRVA